MKELVNIALRIFLAQMFHLQLHDPLHGSWCALQPMEGHVDFHLHKYSNFWWDFPSSVTLYGDLYNPYKVPWSIKEPMEPALASRLASSPMKDHVRGHDGTPWSMKIFTGHVSIYGPSLGYFSLFLLHGRPTPPPTVCEVLQGLSDRINTLQLFFTPFPTLHPNFHAFLIFLLINTKQTSQQN